MQTDQQYPGRWQFTLRSLLFLTCSIALGFFFWKMEQDWFVGALATISFWVVLGLAAQTNDIWNSSRRGGDLTPDVRWGLRFALAWRLAVCFLIGVCFLVRLLVRFHILSMNDGSDYVFVASQEMWNAVLLISIVAAIAGSLGFADRSRRRPWSWAVYIFRGFIAGFLFLLILDERIVVPLLVHITVVGILLGQPLLYETDAAAAGSLARIAQFYEVATASAILVLVSCILLWQLSVRWRSAGWQRVCWGVLLAASLTIMVLLTARVVFVEIPYISPIMVAHIPVPSPLRLAAAAALTMLLTTAVARRWSVPPSSGVAPEIADWRRDEGRYYHERLILILPLGGIALAKFMVIGRDVYETMVSVYRIIVSWGGKSTWRDILNCIGFLFANPTAVLSLVVVLLVVQIAFSGWSKSSVAIATEQPRWTPGLFLAVWFSLLMIIVCSAPTFAVWHFASYLRGGQFPP